MNVRDKHIQPDFLDRLHRLQGEYRNGEIRCGSLKYAEMLVLEAMEASFVCRLMKQLYDTDLRLLDRTKPQTLN